MKVVAVAARAFRLYAIALGVAAPDDGAGWLGLAVVAGVVAAPAVLVFLFSAALASLAAVPDRVRSAPGDLRDHGLEAQRIFGRRGFGSLLLLPFRLLRLGSGTRETLMPYAPLHITAQQDGLMAEVDTWPTDGEYRLYTGDPTEDWPDIGLPSGTGAKLIDADRGEA